jgi:hypothetical protein
MKPLDFTYVEVSNTENAKKAIELYEKAGYSPCNISMKEPKKYVKVSYRTIGYTNLIESQRLISIITLSRVANNAEI